MSTHARREKFFFPRGWSYGNGNNGHMYEVQVHTIQVELLILTLCIVTKMTRDDHDGYYL